MRVFEICFMILAAVTVAHWAAVLVWIVHLLFILRWHEVPY